MSAYTRRLFLALPAVSMSPLAPVPLAEVDERITYAAQHYDRRPPAETARDAYAAAVAARRGSTDSRSHRRATEYRRLTARALILYAQAQQHRGLPCSEALQHAEASAIVAGDPQIQAHVYALRARALDRAGRHGAAAHLARKGRALAPHSPIGAMLSIKVEAGAWSGLHRRDSVRDAIRAGRKIYRACGDQSRAPRGWSFLDAGWHPADMALSAAGALAVVGSSDAGPFLAQAWEGADLSKASAMRAAVRVVAARVAVNSCEHDRAAELLRDAVRVCPDGRTWLAGEVLTVARTVQTRDEGLAAAVGTALSWQQAAGRPVHRWHV